MKKKKTLKQRLWGEASLLSKTRTVITAIISLGVALGYISGWFNGCRKSFDKPIIERLDRDSIGRHWQRLHNADTTRMILERLDKLEKKK